MNKARRTISLGFSDEKVHEGLHCCYIYNEDEERLDVIAKFLKSGIKAREKVLYFVDTMTTEEMLECLISQGVDFSQMNPEDFAMSDAASGYCPTGYLKPEEMLNSVRDFYLSSLEEDYAGARGSGEMSWYLANDNVDLKNLMTYEAKLNNLVAKYPFTAC